MNALRSVSEPIQDRVRRVKRGDGHNGSTGARSMVFGLREFGERLFRLAPSTPDQARTPRAPEKTRVYAVGDVHGNLEALDRLLRLIAEDAEEAESAGLRCEIVFLGDYVDRGPETRGVIDRLLSLPLKGARHRFLIGNHEEVLLDFLKDPASTADWIEYGGMETLAGYGVRASLGVRARSRCEALRDRFADNLPDGHRAFLNSLEPMVVLGDYVFVHAGIRPGRPLRRQRTEDLLWIREPFLSDRRRHERVVVHGHTIVDEPELRANRIGIDTGAYVTGVLTALVLQEDRRCLIQARV